MVEAEKSTLPILDQDSVKACEEYLRRVQQQISDIEHAAHADLQRYRAEYEERQKDRHRQLYYDLAPLRDLRDELIKNLIAVRSLDRVPFVVPVKPGTDIGDIS